MYCAVKLKPKDAGGQEDRFSDPAPMDPNVANRPLGVLFVQAFGRASLAGGGFMRRVWGEGSAEAMGGGHVHVSNRWMVHPDGVLVLLDAVGWRGGEGSERSGGLSPPRPPRLGKASRPLLLGTATQ